MKSIEALFTLSTADFVTAYRSFNPKNSEDFQTQLQIWVMLKERILAGEDELFDKYLMPLVQPLVNRYIGCLPEYGTYREDFRQEASIDFCFHLVDYEPFYANGAYLGTVFFANRLQTLYSRYKREKEKLAAHTSLDNEDADWAERLEEGGDDLHTTFVKEQVLRTYEKNQDQFTEYYARKVTRKWSKANGYDIFA